MNKSHLTNNLAEKLQISVSKASSIVETILSSMVESLARGDGVEIRGFGSITVKEYKSYLGRNPKTGEEIMVTQKKSPFFRAGKELRELVNAGKDMNAE